MPAARTPAIPDRPSEDEHIERLYAEYGDRLLAYCLAHLDSRAEAEDALQLTFLCAFRALRRGVVPRSESAWLYAIARNVCRCQLRSAARRPKVCDASPESLEASEFDGGGEFLADLRAALEALPERQRSALLLREWQGLSTPEIARRLRLTTPATHALLTRARRSVALALTASRHAALVLVGLVVSLRAWVKGALSGAAAQTAAVTVAVVGVGTTVVAADRALTRQDPPPARAPAVQSIDGVPTSRSTRFGPVTSPTREGATRGRDGSRSVPRTTPDAARVRAGAVPTFSGARDTTRPGIDPAASGELSPSPEPRDDASKPPAVDPTEAVPELDPILDPLLDPLLGDMTGDLPPVDVPEPPPLPDVDLPPVELPQPPPAPPLPPLP